MANRVVTQSNYHVVLEEWWDEDGNYHRNQTQYQMTGGEAHVVNENRDLRLHDRAMKLVNGTQAVRPQVLEQRRR